MFNYSLFKKILTNRKLRKNSFIKNEIALRLLKRLDFIKLFPEKILVVGYTDNDYIKNLKARFPNADILLEDDERSVFNIIISNSTIHLTDNISEELNNYYQKLDNDGILLFSTFGDKSFLSINKAFKEIDDLPHTNKMIDILTWGNLLQNSIYKNPAIESDKITLTYENHSTLFEDLRALNEPLADNKMHIYLTGKNRWSKFLKRLYESLQLEIEALYGYAIKKQDDKNLSPRKNSNRISLEELKKQITEFKKD